MVADASVVVHELAHQWFGDSVSVHHWADVWLNEGHASWYEYTWGDDRLRWQLEPAGEGTRLTLRHTLTKPDMEAMVAAGWHLCFAVLDHLLAGQPVGVIRGRDAMNHGWEQLRDGYADKLRG